MKVAHERYDPFTRQVVESIVDMPDGTPEEVAAHEAYIVERDKKHADRKKIKDWSKTPPTSAKEQSEAIAILAAQIDKLLGD